jgi:ferritin-like metal-binding protein YciE
VSKLIDVLRDANIEDMDLSKVAAKALHNLAVSTKQDSTCSWTADQIKKLDEILTSLGEELDSIMVRIQTCTPLTPEN